MEHLWLIQGWRHPTPGINSSKKGTDSSFLHLTVNIQTLGKGNYQLLAFPKSLWSEVAKWSLASRGAGQPGMYKKGWFLPFAHLTMEGLSKISKPGVFHLYPITVLVWEFKGPNQKGRTEKAAPVFKKKVHILTFYF